MLNSSKWFRLVCSSRDVNWGWWIRRRPSIPRKSRPLSPRMLAAGPWARRKAERKLKLFSWQLQLRLRARRSRSNWASTRAHNRRLRLKKTLKILVWACFRETARKHWRTHTKWSRTYQTPNRINSSINVNWVSCRFRWLINPNWMITPEVRSDPRHMKDKNQTICGSMI